MIDTRCSLIPERSTQLASSKPDVPQYPLAGLRVLDLTRLLPGGYATQLLADFGADVIKVEDPVGGDPARWSEPVIAGNSLYFAALNRNKRSLAINLKHPDGHAAFLRLVADSDVLVESFRPGVMARLGLGPQQLRERFPALIYCAITGYGQDGPWRGRAGHDLNYLGIGGMLDPRRGPGSAPELPQTQWADLAAGALPAVLGILLALLGRSRHGQGDIVDVSMLDGTLALQPLQIVAMLAGVSTQDGARQLHGGDPAYGIYMTADGAYLTLAALEPKFWRRFCEIIGRSDLIPLHGPAAWAHRDALRRDLTRIFATRTLAAWLELFDGEDACVAPVNTLAQAMREPQVRERHLLRDVDLGLGESGQALAPVPRLAGVDAPMNRPPPLLGQDSESILAEAGFSIEEIAALQRSGAVPQLAEG